ncbi:MAG: restriction endonuclease subunit S [Pirellulaceae bacterium]|nr:restriction endonuclease subunit S [Pirellulaceae bacterium]
MTTKALERKLGELFSFKNGRGFGKDEWAATGLPIIRIQNLNSPEALFNHFSGEYSLDILVERGDLLFSWSGTVGSSFGPHIWDREPGLLNQHIFKISIRAEVEPRYAYFALKQITAAIEEAVSGAVGLVHITKEKLTAFTIPVPPLSEQRRIVGILDEAFEGLATAKANAEKNLQNARALFESHLNAVFTQRGDGWVETTLGEMATFRNGINFTKSSRGQSVKIVGVKDFQKHFWAPMEGLDTVTTEGTLPDSDTLKEGDLLFVRSNGNMELIGRSILVGPIVDKVTHSGFTIRARFSRSGVLPKYVCRFLKSNTARRKMIDSGIGTNIKSLNQTTLSVLVVPVPPVAEQTRIAVQFETIEAETQGLESIYQCKLAALDELKKSLLHRAFSGEL